MRETSDVDFSIIDRHFVFSLSLDKLASNLYIKKDVHQPRILIFNSFKWLVTFVAIHDGGLPLHSSMVMYNCSGLVFSGPSGIGKSTISALITHTLKDSIPGSDELNIVFPSKNTNVVFSTPYHSSNGCGRITEKVPFKTIFFLEQAKDHNVKLLSKKLAFKCYLNNVYHISGNKLLTEQMLNTINHLSELNISNKLYFSNNKSVANYIHHFLQTKNETPS